MSWLGIYGASGFGREVMGMLRPSALQGRRPVFIDDACGLDLVNGRPCMSFDQFASDAPSGSAVSIAIADAAVRRSIAEKCGNAGLLFATVKAENVMILDDVKIGDGSIICPFVTVTSNVRIGRHFHANIYSYIAHDCSIGDFVTLAPGVKCNGNVRIDDNAYIGAGAIIRQGAAAEPLVIGRGAVVGMGAVVTKSVPDGMTVVGSPARKFEKEN